MAAEQHYRAVIRNPDFLKLFIGQLGSGIGDRLHQMALLGILLEQHYTKNGPEMAQLVFFVTLPAFIFSLLAVAWTDRWNRKSIMVTSDFLRALFAFGIPLIRHWDPSVRALYGVVFVMGTLATFHGPARLASMPKLVETRLLMTANTLSNSCGAVIGLLAIPLAGLAVTTLGPNPCFVIDGFTFAFSGILIALISRNLRPEIDEEKQPLQRSTLGDIRNGLGYILAHRQALPLVLLGGHFALVSGLLLVTVVAFATTELKLDGFGVGLLISAAGAGMAAGLLTVGRSQRLRPMVILPYFACIALGGAIAIMSTIQTPWVAGPAMFLIGAMAAMASVPADTHLQEIVPDTNRGGVFSVKQLLMAAAFLLSLGVQFGSEWVKQLTPAQILTGLGIFCALGSAVLLLVHRAATRQS